MPPAPPIIKIYETYTVTPNGRYNRWAFEIEGVGAGSGYETESEAREAASSLVKEMESREGGGK